jgi:hypothetical protein
VVAKPLSHSYLVTQITLLIKKTQPCILSVQTLQPCRAPARARQAETGLLCIKVVSEQNLVSLLGFLDTLLPFQSLYYASINYKEPIKLSEVNQPTKKPGTPQTATANQFHVRVRGKWGS